jgi:RPA family protein
MEQQNQPPPGTAQRQVAHKVPIGEILRNQYVEQQGWNPNYLQINDKQVSRVNLVATVIDKQTTETLSTLTLDDSTGVIQARAFNEDTKKVLNVNIGDPVLLIGRPRKYNEQTFLNIEIIKKVDSLWTKVRKQELESNFNMNKVETSPSTESPKVSMNQEGEKLLNLIKSLDSDTGADLNEVISQSGLQEPEAEALIQELIKLGEIYEPQPNKVKILG